MDKSNNWGIFIIADLDCGIGETLFNLKINTILEELENNNRDFYITLIITAEFGFLQKLKGIAADGTPNETIKTVIYQNTAQPQIKEALDVSTEKVVKDLMINYYCKNANAKFNAVITWGHGMAYSIFKKHPDAISVVDTPPTSEDVNKHFRMINDKKFKSLFIIPNHNSSNPHISTVQSKNYLSMDELASAIQSSFGKKIDLVVLSNCGMAYARTGITLSKVCDYWIAGEENTSDFAILPDGLLSNLKNKQTPFLPKDFGISLCNGESAEDFKLFEMRHFGEFSKTLRNFSKAIYVNIKSHKDLLIDIRNKCSAIGGDPTHVYHLISFFDFCKQIQDTQSRFDGIKFLQRFCINLLILKKDIMITSNENDMSGLSIFFPTNSDILDPLSIDEKTIIGIPVEEKRPSKEFSYNPYLWEFNVVKLIGKEKAE